LATPHWAVGQLPVVSRLKQKRSKMAFASGLISFRRFAVITQQPARMDEMLLQRFTDHAMQVGETGTAEEEYGWCGGRHVLDAQFSFENNVFADALLCALRVDSNKVPSELRKAYQAIEEEALAAGNPSGFASKLQKREAKDSTQRKIDDDLRSGRFRRSKLVPLLWDLPEATVFCAVGSSAQEKLLEIF